MAETRRRCASAADIEPIEHAALRVTDTLTEHATVQANLWLGVAGATAVAHYDIYENIFVQIRGRKRVRLAAPENWWNLYMFPATHPSDRQSQVIDIDQPDLQRFPEFAGVPFLETTLHPGDVLYVPSFWIHHVEALDDSISVNVWTDSHSMLAMQAVRPAARRLRTMRRAAA